MTSTLEEAASDACSPIGEETLTTLLNTHQRLAFSLAYRLLKRESDADDAVQDAFLLAVRTIRGSAAPLRDVNSFRSWFLRIVTNTSLRQLRGRSRVSPVSVDEFADAIPAPERLQPEREAERRQLRADIVRVLLALPDAQRVALTLREFQGLSYEEIASTIGVSRAAVEALLFRARQGFRVAYGALKVNRRAVGCSEFASLLSVLIDNELDEVAWRRSLSHLDLCSSCRREQNGLRRTRRPRPIAPLVGSSAGRVAV
jgi:RNA polymerase sigma-70 factor (ECF subfamily)